MAVETESAWARYPDHRIDIGAPKTSGQVWAGDVLLAESDRCLVVTETKHVDRLYFPESDVRWELFTQTEHHSVCPFKGDADYWSLTAAGQTEDNVVWTYRTPSPEVADIKGYVCFYQERLRVVLNDQWPDGSRVATGFPAWGDAVELVRLMDVESLGDRKFVGPAYGDTARNVVEGGQLLGEAIVAACKSVPGQRVTSASMIFSKAASFDAPVDLDVDVLRGGRTFSTVEVRVTQDSAFRSAALLLMNADTPSVFEGSVAMPDVPGPEDCVPFDFGVTGRDIRVVDGAYDPDPERVGPPELYIWIRFRDAPAEPYLHAALVAQPTTHWTIAAAMRPHRGFGESMAHVTLSTGVMKTTIAFHEDVDVTDWLLYANPAIYAGRGLAQGEGHVFTQDGRLVASYTAQVMIRAFDAMPAAMGQDFKTAM
jgi:acyl-CoA thioesterase II